MDAELATEWRNLQESATAQLATRNPPRRGLSYVVKVIELPSFDDASTHELFRESTGAAPSVGRRTVWRRSVDLAKFEGPLAQLKHGRSLAPTLETQIVSLVDPEVADLVRLISRLRVPAPPIHSVVGVDGVTHRLILGDGFTQLGVEWWVRPPEGWEDVASLKMLVRSLIDTKVARCGLTSA